MKTLVLICLPILAWSQNLVVNPSFEEVNPRANLRTCSYTKLPEAFAVLKGWSTVLRSTPDVVLRPDSLTDCYFPKPHSGEKLIGFINYLQQFGVGDAPGYHEYLQGTLTEPLKSGEKYKIQFWLYHTDSLAIQHVQWLYGKQTPDVLPLATNNIGIYFLERSVPVTREFSLLDDEPHFNIKEIIQTKKEQWKLITGTFTADKPYRNFIIGNFFSDGDTQIDKQAQVDRIADIMIKDGKYVKKIWRIAYYCIDDINITLIDKDEKILITESTPYTFEKVLFNTGKATLLPGAEEELKELANYIQQNPSKQFEIGGHTDNLGDDATNQILSEKRAKTVYDYLLQLDVNKKQLSYKGYGETTPKASNDEAIGRQQNRRVECKILK